MRKGSFSWLRINLTMAVTICSGEFTGTENHAGCNDTIQTGIIYSA
jgi:hypothetical protein